METENEMTEQTYQTTTKSGRGSRHGVVSEVSAFLHIKPGEVEELRAAIGRFQDRLRRAPSDYMVKFGLVDMRHVIFDNDTRLLWITSFDTDWDPYIDDSVQGMGIETWYDWLQHCEECPPDVLTLGSKPLKDFLQSCQTRAIGFYRTIANQTVGQMIKAQRVHAALDRVLEQPEASTLLQHPALKPLLDEAAD